MDFSDVTGLAFSAFDYTICFSTNQIEVSNMEIENPHCVVEITDSVS